MKEIINPYSTNPLESTKKEKFNPENGYFVNLISGGGNKLVVPATVFFTNDEIKKIGGEENCWPVEKLDLENRKILNERIEQLTNKLQKITLDWKKFDDFIGKTDKTEQGRLMVFCLTSKDQTDKLKKFLFQ